MSTTELKAALQADTTTWRRDIHVRRCRRRLRRAAGAHAAAGLMRIRIFSI
jgi:hypothetical protein